VKWPVNNSYTPSVRSATAWKLSAPSFVEMAICASMLLHPNVFGFLLAPLMFTAFVLLIAAVAIASKNHEQTSRNAWTWLVLAGVAQILTFMALAALGRRS
jgi:hypothetical protein